MIKIRLAKYGFKSSPFYRIVAVEHTRKRSGLANDILGFWDPFKKTLNIDKKKLEMWKSSGAQFTPAFEKLIKNEKAS